MGMHAGQTMWSGMHAGQTLRVNGHAVWAISLDTHGKGTPRRSCAAHMTQAAWQKPRSTFLGATAFMPPCNMCDS
eukprot:365530-Chlamydomonas_euryale.AAC.4